MKRKGLLVTAPDLFIYLFCFPRLWSMFPEAAGACVVPSTVPVLGLSQQSMGKVSGWGQEVFAGPGVVHASQDLEKML